MRNDGSVTCRLIAPRVGVTVFTAVGATVAAGWYAGAESTQPALPEIKIRLVKRVAHRIIEKQRIRQEGWDEAGRFSSSGDERLIFRVVGIEGRGPSMGARLRQREHGRQYEERGDRRQGQSANHRASERSGLRAGFADAKSHWQHPGHHRETRHE